MAKMLWEYDVKVLLALEQAIGGNSEFLQFLLENGYPELAAFASAIRADKKALKWLFDNGSPELGILSDAIDSEDTAIAWLKKNNLTFYIIFADACRGVTPARELFKKKQHGCVSSAFHYHSGSAETTAIRCLGLPQVQKVIDFKLNFCTACGTAIKTACAIVITM